MNELVVPPAPHWYKSLVVACAPDNTLVYGSQHDIVVLKERNPEESVDVQLIYAAHTKHVVSISLNKNWNNPHCYGVSLGEDKITKVWNLKTLEKKTTNKDHVEHKQPVVGAVFAGDNRVVSAAEDGFIIVWNINTNESNPLKNLFKEKVHLTCLSSCPHATWLLAFGLNNGCIVIADLRRDGQVLYKLRGHYQAVVSFSWCPAPVNVFPRYTNNRVKNKAQDVTHTTNVEECVKSDNSQEIVDTSVAEQCRGNESIESESNEAKKKVNPWVNLVHVDDDEVVSERHELEITEVQDFLEECDKLKIKILGITTSPEKNVEANKCSKETESEEIKKTPTKVKQSEEHEIIQKLNCDRPFPVLFDPSGDFLDDSFCDFSPLKTDTSEIANIGHEEEEKNTVEQKTDLGNDSGIVKDEISSTKNEVVYEEPRTEYLLASSGKDKTIHIWRAGTDGRMQTFFHTSKKGNRRDKNANSWLSVCWVTPDTIVTSAGELLSWPIPKPKESDKQFKVVHRAHSSHIYNIVAPPKYMTQHNWRDKVDLTIWTWGQDGKLVNYDLNTKKICHSYTTVSSLTTCFDACSYLDPNRLAVGLRDGVIHMWDLSLPHKSSITMQRYQQKFTHKVSAIAWHPLKEMLLGFGTEEGRVGHIDLMSKKTTLFPHYFRNTIYKVEWGPIKGDIDNLGFYALAEGRIAIYNLQKPNEDPLLVELPEKMYVYRFSWKPNYSLLLLNGKDGNLLILKTDLVVVANLYPTEKGMNDIVWHPDAITDKTDIAPRCNWFAAATNKGVLVFDCVSIEESADVANRFVALFEGHLRTPSSLVWCPFEGDKIVSAASDGLAHVWDVKTKTAISTFASPYFAQNPVVIWSPVDPDLIIMGDRLIRIWRISQNPPKIDKEFLEARKRLLVKSSKTDSEKSDKNKIKVEIPSKDKSISKTSVIPEIYVANNEKHVSRQIADMKHLINSLENENSYESDSKVDPFKIFLNKEQVSQLLDAHYQQQKNEGKLKSCELISLFKGNVGETIQNAINENRVTPSIIALAPMVSSRLWQEACTVYARRLSEDANSDPLETAMYFLACHKVDEAINCLRLRSMHKEALALAKHRLLDNSGIITQVTEEWAQCCVKNGNFEKAAFCYISIKQYDNAAKVLARRNHKEYLEFALELAEKEGNKGLCDSIKLKCAELENTQLNRSSDIAGLQSDIEENIPSKGDAVLKSLELELGNTQLSRSSDVSLLSDIEQNILSKGDAILKSLELELGNTQVNKSSDIVGFQSDMEQNIPSKGDSVLKSLDQNQEIISERSSTIENEPHSAIKNEFSDAPQVDESPCNDEISKSENPEKECLDQNQEIISERSSTIENEPHSAVKNEFSDAPQVGESPCNDEISKSENPEKE